MASRPRLRAQPSIAARLARSAVRWAAVGARLRIRGLPSASDTRVGTVERLCDDGVPEIRFDGAAEPVRVDIRSPLAVSLHEPFVPKYVLDTKDEMVEVRVRLAPVIAEGPAGKPRIVLRAEIEATLRREVAYRAAED